MSAQQHSEIDVIVGVTVRVTPAAYAVGGGGGGGPHTRARGGLAEDLDYAAAIGDDERAVGAD